MSGKRSEVQSYYKNKTIFITGASGFVGKILLEKLLNSCSDINKIYILIRSKKKCSSDDRLSNIFKLPIFDQLKLEKPNVFQKVIPLSGDITLDNLGLSEEKQKCLINEVHVVFHCAASINFTAKLKNAVEMNIVGTKRILDLAKEMKQLECFQHLSTAFCHVDQAVLEEYIYDSVDPHDVMRLVQWLDEETINFLTPKLIDPHPNCYTYTKCLSETLVANEYPNLPCCIIRPSIVTPAFKDPLPGWVDNLNGPIGVLVGAGKGVIRSVYWKADCFTEIIPVDIAVNNMIVIACRIGTNQEKSKSMPVFNITEGNLMSFKLREVWDIGLSLVHKYPFEEQIWYPGGDIRSSKFVHNLFAFFFHLIPAYLIDFLMLIFRRKRFMIRLQKQISVGLEVLEYFNTRNWIVHNNKMITIFNELSPEDKIMFQMYCDNTVDKTRYFKDCILGTRQYCLKENLSSLPRTRRRQKILYVVHITTKYLFYFGVLYYIYNIEIVESSLGYIMEQLKCLPFIDGLVEKMYL